MITGLRRARKRKSSMTVVVSAALLIGGLLIPMIARAASAKTVTLYADPTTGQVFMKPARNRVRIGDYIPAQSTEEIERKVEMKTQQQLEQDRAAEQAPHPGNQRRQPEPDRRALLQPDAAPGVAHKNGRTRDHPQQHAAEGREHGAWLDAKAQRLARHELGEARKHAGGDKAHRRHIEIDCQELHRDPLAATPIPRLAV